MKQLETMATEKATWMFHECFKFETATWLFFNAKKLFQDRLKQRCFTVCFKKNDLNNYVNNDFGVLKHFSPEMMNNGLFHKPWLKILGELLHPHINN